MELHRFDVIVIDTVSVLSFVSVNSMGGAEKEATGNLESSFSQNHCSVIQSRISVDWKSIDIWHQFSHLDIHYEEYFMLYAQPCRLPPSIYLTLPVVLPPYRCHFTTNITHIAMVQIEAKHYVPLHILFTCLLNDHWASNFVRCWITATLLFHLRNICIFHTEQ